MRAATRALALPLVTLASPVFAQTSAPRPTITCAEPKVTGPRFAMDCTYSHQSGPLTLTMRGALETLPGDDQFTIGTRTLEIRRNGTLRQTLDLPKSEIWLGQLARFGLASLDLDFDGSDDLQIATSSPSAGSGLDKAFWLYDPKTQTFVRRPDLDTQLSGDDLTADPKTRTLKVSARAGCCAWRTTTYGWAEGRLLQTENTLAGYRIEGLLAPDGPLADVASIQTFAKTTGGAFCATRIDRYDPAGRITTETIETKDETCEQDAYDYRRHARAFDPSLDGTRHNGGGTDLYRNGILLQRTIVYDPPKRP